MGFFTRNVEKVDRVEVVKNWQTIRLTTQHLNKSIIDNFKIGLWLFPHDFLSVK